MYHCIDKNHCSTIDNSGYYFTNAGEMYYCIYDSEEQEETECSKQLCTYGQYYYLNDSYYYCNSGSFLMPVTSKQCS